MDYLNKFLITSSHSKKLDAAICIACELMKKTLNTYYSHTDMSKTYCIAMGEHRSTFAAVSKCTNTVHHTVYSHASTLQDELL